MEKFPCSTGGQRRVIKFCNKFHIIIYTILFIYLFSLFSLLYLFILQKFVVWIAFLIKDWRRSPAARQRGETSNNKHNTSN